MAFDRVKALTFDVFGTVVDVRKSLIRELSAWAKQHGKKADWTSFASGWVAGYSAAVDAINMGQRPWVTVDAINRMTLDGLLRDFGFPDVIELERKKLNNAWHRLRPWGDVKQGLKRLRRRKLRIATLTNANFALLWDLKASTGLPWDALLSAEAVKSYKPDPAVYQMAATQLGLTADEIMMVAAHEFDLDGAAGQGMRTAFVSRPQEFGPADPTNQPPLPTRFDLAARDFRDLAKQLGA